MKSVSQQPLSDDDFDLIPLATGIFVDNRELRPGVDYLVSPGAQLRFGEDRAAGKAFSDQLCLQSIALGRCALTWHHSAQVTLQMTSRRYGSNLKSLRPAMPLAWT